MSTPVLLRSKLRAAGSALLVAVLALAGCTGPQGPAGLGAPVLALAIPAGPNGVSGVTVFSSHGPSSEMTRTRHFNFPENRMAYAALIGPDGDFYVSNFAIGTISIVSPEEAMAGSGPNDATTTAAKMFSSPDMNAPGALAFDNHGNLWVADTRNTNPNAPGPNRLLRFENPSSIADGSAVPAATIIDLDVSPVGFFPPYYLYSIYIDDMNRLWYTDYQGWNVGRIDNLLTRGAHETDVVPDMQMVTWDPTDADDEAFVVNPVGIAVSAAGDLYLGSHNGDHVYRFDDAASWTGYNPDVEPDAFIDVGITKPRFVAIDEEGALWALNNGERQLARVVGHESGTGNVTLTPTTKLTWGDWGQVFGGGINFGNYVR